MQEFIAIGVVGAVLSLFVEWVQARFGTDSKGTRLIAIIGSVMLGTLVVVIKEMPFYQSILGVLSAASTVYALFFSSKKNNADA